MTATPTDRSRPLAPFVGSWTLDGRQHGGTVGPEAPIAGTEHFEWLTGGAFLVHHFDAHLGNDPAACIEIIGPDDGDDAAFTVDTFYNDGQRNRWRLRQDRDGGWLLTGSWPAAQGGTTSVMQVRCTIAFGDGGATRTARWESSRDGGATWQTFWDVRSRRGPAAL